MRFKLVFVFLLLSFRAEATDRCLVLSMLPTKDQCQIQVLNGADKCGVFDDRLPGELMCRDSPHLSTFSCICNAEAGNCPYSTADILELYEGELTVIEMFSGETHRLHPCLPAATIRYPERESAAVTTVQSDPAESQHSSPSSSDGLSTSPPSSSSAVPESSTSDQNTAEGDSTSEGPISSTSSPTTVVESRTEDDGSDEITTSPRYQSTRIVDNTYNTVPFSTIPTGSKPEVDDKASDFTWIYFVVGLILALVALSTIGGGLYCKLRKKAIVATKPKEGNKANQRQAEGTLATPAEVRIEIPAERPSIPVKDTAPPMPDIALINQSLMGTTGPMGSPNEDDLNTAGSTITECEISVSTTMTEEMTGGSGTSGL